MIKLIDILKEGRIYLTADETRQIEEMIPYIIDTIKGEHLNRRLEKKVGQINYESADKTPGTVTVYVTNDQYGGMGYHQTNDPKNPNDNVIKIQQKKYYKYFTNIGGFINKTYKTLTGDENVGIENLRITLKHELIHAKDPAINQYRSNWSIEEKDNLWVATYTSGDGKRTKSFKFKSEDEAINFYNQQDSNNDIQSYYKSWAEFQTMTGQFFEAIVAGINRIDVSTVENVKKIEIALTEILNFFSGKSTEFSQETYDFLQNTQSRNYFQKLIKDTETFIVKSGFTFGNKPTESALDIYMAYIDSIKTYNPEGYKEFLKDLYKLIDIVKDQLNKYLLKKNIQYQVKLKEMQYINEAKRWQKLAGIITEDFDFLEEEGTVSDDVIEKAIAQAVRIDPTKVDLEKIENGEPLTEEELNEIAVTTVVTIAGLIPIALNVAGWATNRIKQKFGINLSNQQKQQLARVKQSIEKKEKEIETLDKANNKPAEDKARKELEKLIHFRDSEFGSSIANKLKSAGESLHHAYVYPIERLLAGIAYFQKKGSKLKDKHYREKVANILYAITMVTIAGAGVISHIKHLAGVGPIITTIADLVKGGKSIADIAKEVLIAI
jgi:hypothetical protein